MKKSTKVQKARIKILQNSLAIDDLSYRDMLASYNVRSCKDLDIMQAFNLIKKLESFGSGNNNSKKYDDLKGLPERDGLASSAQLRKLEAMWKNVSYMKTSKTRAAALETFCIKHIGFGILKLNSIEIRKMIKTIEMMGKK